MTNGTPRALEAKLSTFTSNCKHALERLGVEAEGSDAEVRKTLAKIDPKTFVQVRSESGIELSDIVGR